MIWVFDAEPFLKQLRFYPSKYLSWPHRHLHWSRERPSIVSRKRSTYLDVGGDLLFLLASDYGKGIGTLNQQGVFVAKSKFLTETFSGLLSHEGLHFVQNARESERYGLWVDPKSKTVVTVMKEILDVNGINCGRE